MESYVLRHCMINLAVICSQIHCKHPVNHLGMAMSRARWKGHEKPLRCTGNQGEGKFHRLSTEELDMAIMVIDLSSSHDPCLQKMREGRLIGTLETSFPS